MNKIKERLRTGARQAKISRYRTYKRLGFLGKRKNLDRLVKALFVLLLFTTTVILFYPQPEPQPGQLSDALTPAQTDEYDSAQQGETEPVPTAQKTYIDPAVEEVHEEFEDVPVISEQSATLIELERGVADGTVEMAQYTLQAKEALSTVLNRAKISASERVQISDAIALLVDLKTLKPGTNILVFKNNSGDFLGLSIPFASDEIVAVIKEPGGIYTPFSHEGRVETKSYRVQGTIERTFSGSTQKAGLPKALASYITNALDGEVDFSTFKVGDTFDIIYEKKLTAGGLELDTEVIYIGFTIGGKPYHRYAWTDGAGSPGFYSPKGELSAKMLMKRPLKARARLSSPYGNRRHPILMYNVFHSGVDLAAPMNTPIMAAGDGVITQLGRKGAYGKYIRIKHSSGYQTAYAHMNGYRSGLKVGSKVKRGEVIGYVGSTGRSTGPHCHFEVIKNGKTTNPFGNHTLNAKRLSGFELEQFQSFAESVHPDFQMHLIGTLAPVPPKKPIF